MGRKKNCPINIKKKLESIKKKELDVKESNKKFKEFKKENKNIISEYYRLSRQRWKSRRKVNVLERDLIGLLKLQPIYIKK